MFGEKHTTSMDWSGTLTFELQWVFMITFVQNFHCPSMKNYMMPKTWNVIIKWINFMEINLVNGHRLIMDIKTWKYGCALVGKCIWRFQMRNTISYRLMNKNLKGSWCRLISDPNVSIRLRGLWSELATRGGCAALTPWNIKPELWCITTLQQKNTYIGQSDLDTYQYVQHHKS